MLLGFSGSSIALTLTVVKHLNNQADNQLSNPQKGRYLTMTKKELIHEVAYETGISISDSKEIVTSLFHVMTEALLRGEEVRIANLATFKVVDRAPRLIHTSTGEIMKGLAGKRVKVRMSETVRRVLDPAFRDGKKN